MALDKNAISKEAQKFAAKGQFDKAIAEWKKLIKESPHDANIFNTIGDLCLKKNSKPEAVDAYKRAADILAEDGFTSKAIALYKKVLNIDPTVVDVHLALGDMNAEKGLTGSALESYKIAADHYSHHKETVKALKIYQKMADLNPANLAFRIKLADMYAKEGMKAEAAKAYLAAADVHMSKDAFKDARQLFEKILALDPNNKEVYHKAGIVYFKEGKFVEACKTLKPAFENDPSNTELTKTYLEALSKAGKGSEAEEVLKKLVEGDPANAAYREQLYRFYLSSNNLDKALGEISLLADARVEQGEPGPAEELLKEFVSQNPEFVHGRRKLAEFYFSLNRTDDAANEYIQAADVLSNSGDVDKARAFLDRALEIAPDLAEAKDRIERLEAQDVRPKAEPELSAPETELISKQQPAAHEPAEAILEETPIPAPAAAEPSVEEEDPAINEAIVEADVLLKYGLAAKAAEQLETLAGKFPDSPRVRFKLRDLYAEQGNMDKTVEHALRLADLYKARGASEQAKAVLQATEEMAPNHPAILARHGKAPQTPKKPVPPQSTAPAMPEALAFEMPDMGEQPLEEISPEAIQPPKISREPVKKAPAVPQKAPEAFEETVPAPSDAIPFEGFDLGAPEEPFAVPETPLSEPQSPVDEFAVPEQQAPDVPTETFEPSPEPPVSENSAEVDVSEIWAEAEFYFQQGLFDEAKKHYAKIIGLVPSDRRAINRLSEIAQEAEETQEFTKLADAVDELESAISSEEAPSEMAMSSSDKEAIRSLMQEIKQLKQEEPPESPLAEEVAPEPPRKPAQKQKPAPPPPTVGRAVSPPPGRTTAPSREDFFSPPAQKASEPPRDWAEAATKSLAKPEKSAEEEFFDLGAEIEAESKTAVPKQAARQEEQSEDFFDLAAELRDELSSVKMPAQSSAPAEEQSLDDIFEEFKKGVEQQAVKEDADTHYNLGVAYKEMGLLDDAIAEFIMTPEDEPKVIQSRYMLGLCYMEKGEYQSAIQEIQNALDYSQNMGIDAHHRIEMHYDLGLAYQGAGNNERALQEFSKVMDIDRGYRDVTNKVKELQHGGFISLDQIKDDIEKEISSKFFEEGERIEREEKHKRNERVKG
jgi:pilus assembly protein FimV